jgi:hypothetical protein
LLSLTTVRYIGSGSKYIAKGISVNFDQQEYIFSSPGFSGIISDAVKFFVSRNPLSLKDMLQFSGAGVYGLYYSGDEELYQKISAVNQTSLVHPIYIGKAVPPG